MHKTMCWWKVFCIKFDEIQERARTHTHRIINLRESECGKKHFVHVKSTKPLSHYGHQKWVSFFHYCDVELMFKCKICWVNGKPFFNFEQLFSILTLALCMCVCMWEEFSFFRISCFMFLEPSCLWLEPKRWWKKAAKSKSQEARQNRGF